MLLEHRKGVGIEHRRGDPRDHVCAERLLLVEDRLHGLGLAGLEVHQRRDDGGRAEIEGERVTLPGRVARLDVDQQVVRQHGRDLPVRIAQRLAERAHHRQRDTQLEVVHAGEHALEIRRLVLERRLRELEVALLHRRPQDDVAADTDKCGLRARLERRHLERQVFLRNRAAGEAPAALQLLGRERARIDRAERRVTRHDAHLALLARPVAAAGRVDRNAVPARCVEDRRAGEHARFLDCVILTRLEKAKLDALGTRLIELDDGLGAHAAASACFLRKSAIQRAPHSSRPSRKSVARTASTVSRRRASMIALVSP